MTCSKANNEYRILLSGLTDDFHLKTDGKLYVKESVDEPSQEYNADKYCLDNFVGDSDEKANTSVKLNGLICYSPNVESNHYGVSASCMLISCFFIILTVAVYVFLPRLRTLNGMVMITYLLNLFVAFLFMATMQILLLKDKISYVDCICMTFIIYFSILAAFFWLNVMCYDLWSKLRSSQNMAHGFATSARLRFLSYSCYAFGLPTVLTILLAALEFSNLPVHIKLLPHLRRQGCFLSGTSKLLYLYTPILLACMANLIFFILTAKLLAHLKKQTQGVRKNKDSQRFALYIKLFIVTGINWVLEVISSLYPEANYFWQFTDAYNVLVGFIIFIIFVCKKKTLISLRRRYQMLTGKKMSRTETTNTRTSSCIFSHQSKDDSQIKSNVSMDPKTEQKRKKSLLFEDVRQSLNTFVNTR
ncbi:unnamed protein product [Arctia plantaginis]|uniref:G-protein coupled receptors family 2 profile 2 domain-containing protein n=1 Tax=Arctia plantaginis TaxID=874455 RepID=A0A8S1BR77_ARCPL|nr:unnamed protein product [Arctia plantaginis]